MPLVELLPVTYDPSRQLMWTDENFRRISDAIEKLGSPASGGGGSGLSVPAGNVIAGTFGSNVGNGNYVFPGQLTVNSTLNATGNTIVYPSTDSDNKIVLRSDAKIGTRSGDDMYFYSGGGNYSFEAPGGSWAMRYGPGEVNGGERGLWVSGNDQATERYAAGWFRQMNSGQGYYHQAHGGGWFMQDGTYFRIYGDKEIYTNNKVRGQIARMGDGIWGDHATFGHNNYGPGSDYCGLLQRWDSMVWLRSNNEINMYVSGLDVMRFKNSGGLSEVTAVWPMNLCGTAAHVGGDMGGGRRQLGACSSSKRWKKNIKTLPKKMRDEKNPLFKVRPVVFQWKEGNGGNGADVNRWRPRGTVGIISEELAKIAPELVSRETDGKPTAPDIYVFLGYLVNAVQFLLKRIEALETANG